MEHLYLPNGAPLRKLKTEWGGYDDYIGIGFEEYAEIKKFGFLLKPLSPTPLEQLLEQHAIKRNDLSTFLNTWLFSSLLYNFFESVSAVDSVENLYIHDDFQREEAQNSDKSIKRFFCTSQLVRLLDDWAQRVKKIEKERMKRIHRDLHSNLAIAFNVLKTIGLDTCHFPGLYKVVAVTCDTLSLTLDRTFPDEGPNSLPWSIFGWGEADIDRMVSLGWCPVEANSSFGQLPALQALLFYGNMSRHYQRASHVSCEKNMCVASYRGHELPSHYEANCACKESLGLEGNLKTDALDIIEQGGIAIIKLSSSNKAMEMEIMEISAIPDSSYIAISHVWGDGMGNPNANSLPLCRLEYLFDSVAAIQTAELSLDEEDGSEIQSVYFWMDTICCPISPLWAKENVLSKMREIYERAKKVLVLDWELAGLEVAKMQDLEIAGRVLRSNWTRRLWTLQEGFLAQDLVVQFHDGEYALDVIAKLNLGEVSFDATWIAAAIKSSFWSIRRRLANDDEAKAHALLYLFMSTRNRSVTVRSDEPLCLAAFLGLDVSRILKVEENERMAEFWRLLDRSDYKIPKAILFYEGPKLSIRGLTWAPSTLLQYFDASFLGQFGAGSLRSESICAEGLLIRSECAALKIPPRDEILAKEWRVDSADEDVLKLRDVYTGKWYRIFSASAISQLERRRASMASTDAIERPNGGPNLLRSIISDQEYAGYALIFPSDILSLNEDGASSICALIGIKHDPKDAKFRYARNLSAVPVVQVSSEDATIYEFAYQMTQTFLRISTQHEGYEQPEVSEADQRGATHKTRNANVGAPSQHRQAKSWSLKELRELFERPSKLIDEMLLIAGSDSKTNALRRRLHTFLQSALARNSQVSDSLERLYGHDAGRQELQKITRQIYVGSFHIDVLPLSENTQWCID